MSATFEVLIDGKAIIEKRVKNDHDCLRAFMTNFDDFFKAMKQKNYCVTGSEWKGELIVRLYDLP